MYVYIHVCMYVCIDVYVCVCVCVCVCIRMYVCMHVSNVCMYVCVFVCIRRRWRRCGCWLLMMIGWHWCSRPRMLLPTYPVCERSQHPRAQPQHTQTHTHTHLCVSADARKCKKQLEKLGKEQF